MDDKEIIIVEGSKVPNIIYDDNNCTIGEIKTHQDYKNWKVDNIFCVNSPLKFEAFHRIGYSFYLIDTKKENDADRYYALLIKRVSGKRMYYGMNDLPLNKDEQTEFELSLPKEALDFIENLCEENKNIKSIFSKPSVPKGNMNFMNMINTFKLRKNKSK